MTNNPILLVLPTDTVAARESKAELEDLFEPLASYAGRYPQKGHRVVEGQLPRLRLGSRKERRAHRH